MSEDEKISNNKINEENNYSKKKDINEKDSEEERNNNEISKTSKKLTLSRIPLTSKEKEEFENSTNLKISKKGGSVRRKKVIRRPKDTRGGKEIKKSKKINKEKEIDLEQVSEEGSNLLKKDGKFVTSDKELVAKIKESII